MEEKMTRYEVECKLKAVKDAIFRHEIAEASWSWETARLLKLEQEKLEKMLAEMGE